MDNHEDIAVVRKIEANIVQVEIERTGSCEGCAVSGICNSNNKIILHKIKTDLKLMIGDKVQVNIAPSLRVFSSFVVFIFPIITMVSFYLISKYLFILNEDLSIVISLLSLLLSGLFIYLIDKKFENKLSFTITKKL
ncbi:MAG: SoxR reducing system RseC family protein [Candidatus Cloacimonetes bacterium]|jgi:positive regulator of sigma E activity|nr:SoxR reducing system RseC family protein [Candidatus Cloacimonadota bacterium]